MSTPITNFIAREGQPTYNPQLITAETPRERRNRLARERYARNKASSTTEEKRERRNRLARERYAKKKQEKIREKSIRAINERLQGMMTTSGGSWRLQSRIGNISIVNARDNLFNKARQFRTKTQESMFLEGKSKSAFYAVKDLADYGEVLDRYRERLLAGEKLIALYNGKGVTLTYDKYEEIKENIRDHYIITGGDDDMGGIGSGKKSDQEMEEALLQGGIVKFTRLNPRKGNNYTVNEGEFFPYTHNHPDEHISNTLARIGCWHTVHEDNYKDNCLWLAFKDAGVAEHILTAMKFEFLQRKIARKNIKKIAEEYKLCVTIRTEGDKNKITYGPSDGFNVSLSLIQDHYIHNFRTDICSYAFKNYEKLKHKSEWWRFCKSDERGNGIEAIALVRLLLQSEYLTPISLASTGIFKTQFYDKVTEIATLEYTDEHCRLKHPERNGTGPYIKDEYESYNNKWSLKKKEQITAHRKAICKNELARLDAKITRCCLGIEEQEALLRKHIPPHTTYDFDFETCPFGKHKEFLCCFKEDREGSTVDEHRGFDCAKQFLDTIARRHGVIAGDPSSLNQLKAPVIKLRAHNITYDFSFLAPHLRRVDMIERCTSIITGTARYYCSSGYESNGPNKDICDWMDDAGIYLVRKKQLDEKTWWKIRAMVNKTKEFINFEYCVNDLEIEKAYLKILYKAPWDMFKPREAFKLMKVIDLTFQDSYKMIAEPLSKFGKMFNLDQHKEVIPYTLYTEHFVENNCIASWDYILNNSKNFDDFDTLKENLEKWECKTTDGKYDMMKYASIYCKADVEVLQKGWNKFRNMFLSEMDMDTNCYCTLASVVDSYFIERNIYDGVYEVAGVPLKFHAEASVGGRVMCPNNEKVETTEDMDDSDANSLYTSAQIRLGGFLKGKPKVWNSTVDLEKCDGYCVEIRVTHIEKRLRFPICRLKTKEGGCNWTNDLVGEKLVVDKVTLEDLVRFQGAKYEILRGYYYDQGRNNALADIVRDMYNRRQRYKAEENPLQLVLKMALNCSYGICGLKPISTDTKYVTDDNRDNFIQNHCNHIKSFTDMPNGDTRFDLHKQINTHFNRQHCAMEVLSMSKRIMNEVMCLAEDIGIAIAYQDTDSMHIPRKDSKRLGIAYEEMYGKPLLGKGEGSYGQFSTDFEFDQAWHFRNDKFTKVGKSIKTVGEVRAIKSIFLGKKAYIDILSDTIGNIAYHIRMKGIASRCLLHKVATCFNQDPYVFFKHLLNGNEAEIDLTSDGNCCFKTTKSHAVYTQEIMTRKVKF